ARPHRTTQSLRASGKFSLPFSLLLSPRRWHAIRNSKGWSEPLGEQGMRRTLQTALAATLMLAGLLAPAGATSRIKDLANIEGVRQNQLIGYGLVVGLNGTG